MTMLRQTEERAPAVAAPDSPSLKNGGVPSANKKHSRSKLIMTRLQAKGSKKSGFSGSVDIQPMRERGGGGGGRRLSFGGGGTAVPSSSGRAAPVSAKQSHVDRVVHEMVETERTYVRDLHFIVKDYLSVIIDRRGLPLTRDQVYTLFGNIEDIYAFNSDLLQGLEDCAGDFVAIANCFVLKSEDFHIYTQYCTNYPSSMAILSDCLQNKALLAFFRERQAALRHSLPLGSYLLKPVQRILKYHLFLKDIASKLGDGANGHEVVHRALAAMHSVAQYINDMKRKHEHAIRAQEIQGLLVCGKERLDVGQLGELVQEGTFHVKQGRKERTLFLFAMALLITKRREDGAFSHKSRINCRKLMMSENTKELTFSVWNQMDPKTRVTFQTKSPNEQKLWTFHLKKLILKSHPEAVPERVMQVILNIDPLADHNTPEGKPDTAACRPGGDATSDSPLPLLSAHPPPPPLLQPHDPPWPARRASRKPSRESPRPDVIRRPSGDSADPGSSPWPPGGPGSWVGPGGTTAALRRRDSERRGSAVAALPNSAQSGGEGSSEETAAPVTTVVTPRADEEVSPRPRGSINVKHNRGFATAQCPSEPCVPFTERETSFLKDDDDDTPTGSPLPMLRRHLGPRCRLSLTLAYNNKGSDSDQVAITESSGEDVGDDDDEEEEVRGGVERGAADQHDRGTSAHELGSSVNATPGLPSCHRQDEGSGADDAGGDADKCRQDSATPPQTPAPERSEEASTTSSLATPTSTSPSSASGTEEEEEEFDSVEAEWRHSSPRSPRSPAQVLAGAARQAERPPRRALADAVADRGPSGLPDAAELNECPCGPLPTPTNRRSESFSHHTNGDGCDVIVEEVESFGDDGDGFGEEFDVDEACAEPRPILPRLNCNGEGSSATTTNSETARGLANDDSVVIGNSLAAAMLCGQALQLNRTSSLSKKDRQLIEKIKNYYDKEGLEDAWGAAPVKRRESLAHIPQGKVRNSIFVRTQQLQKIKSEVDGGGATEPTSAGPFGFPAELPAGGATRRNAHEAERHPSSASAEVFDDAIAQTVYDNWAWPSGSVYDNLHCLGSSSPLAKEKLPVPPLPPLPTLQEKASDGEEEHVYGEVDLNAAFPSDAATCDAAGASSPPRPSVPPTVNQGVALPLCNGHAASPADYSMNVDDLCNDLESYYRDNGKVTSSLSAFPVAEQDLESPPRSRSTSDIGATLAEAASSLPPSPPRMAPPAADGGSGVGSLLARSWRKKLGRFGASAGGGSRSGKGDEGDEGNGGGRAARGALGRSLCSSAEAISAEGPRGSGAALARRAQSMYNVESPSPTRVCADKNKNRVYTLAREYSMRIKRTRQVTGAREGGGEVFALPAVLEMNLHNSSAIGARIAEHMHTYDQIIIREGLVLPATVDLPPPWTSPTGASSGAAWSGTGAPSRSPARANPTPRPAESAGAGSHYSTSAAPPRSPTRAAPAEPLPDVSSGWPTVQGLRMRYQGAGGTGGTSRTGGDGSRVVSAAKSTGNLARRHGGDAGGLPAQHGAPAAAGHKPRIWSWNGPNADWRATAGSAPAAAAAPAPQFDGCTSAPLGPRRARENYRRNFVDNDDDENEDYVEIRSPSPPPAPRATGGAAGTTRDGTGDGGQHVPATPGHRAQASSERSLVQKLKERFQPLSYQSHA